MVGKKRKATEQTVEDDQTRNAARGINSNWYLQMAGKMEPEGTLKNNAGLTEMRAWQKQWKQWTAYLKSQGFPMTDQLYAQMLLGRCDQTMKQPLEAMEDIYKLGEKKIWERIEDIYIQSNPLFLRRAKCYENKPVKGEPTSEFATRLKMQYKEAEMEKPPYGDIWSIKY